MDRRDDCASIRGGAVTTAALLISLAIAFLAGALNAVHDTIRHHWPESVFVHWPARLRRFMESDWRERYKREPYIRENRKKWPPTGIADGWHLSKTLNICAWLTLAFVVDPSGLTIWHILAGWLLLGIVRNIGFNLFYDRILLHG